MEDDIEKNPGQLAVDHPVCQLQNAVATSSESSMSFQDLRITRYNLLGPYETQSPLVLNDLKINGREVYAYLDSGCIVSLMSTETMRKCGLTPLLQNSRTERRKVVSVGGEMKVVGKIWLVPASTGRFKFVFTCQVVEGLQTPLLLGIDFLSLLCHRVNLYNGRESLDKTIINQPIMRQAFFDVTKDARMLTNFRRQTKAGTRIRRNEQRSHLELNMPIVQSTKPRMTQILNIQSQVISRCEGISSQQSHMNDSFEEDESCLIQTMSSCQATVLSIPLSILGQEVTVMVDTGCTNTTMSTAMVRLMNLSKLVDYEERLASWVQCAARQERIIGTVVMVPAEYQGKPLVFPSMVMESEELLFVLGLDFLRAYKCCVDVRGSVFEISYEGIPYVKPEMMH